MKVPHKHAVFIHAWADGEIIQCNDIYGWRDCIDPRWYSNYEYRIKPEVIELENNKMKIITYKENYKTWVAFYEDEEGNQVGNCEYGITKKQAILNLRIENDNK